MPFFVQQRAERLFSLRPKLSFPGKAKPVSGNPAYIWRWNDFEVVAHAKTDARGKLKRLAGLKRLPVGAVVEKVGLSNG